MERRLSPYHPHPHFPVALLSILPPVLRCETTTLSCAALHIMLRLPQPSATRQGQIIPRGRTKSCTMLNPTRLA
ncbi:hypothetical protein B0H13DRAFT_2051598 [Mycena leptocephala]|nr:hypothetical protein B0H13DRAFT_2051598 [Mycena leptocephala]